MTDFQKNVFKNTKKDSKFAFKKAFLKNGNFFTPTHKKAVLLKPSIAKGLLQYTTKMTPPPTRPPPVSLRASRTKKVFLMRPQPLFSISKQYFFGRRVVPPTSPKKVPKSDLFRVFLLKLVWGGEGGPLLKPSWEEK